MVELYSEFLVVAGLLLNLKCYMDSKAYELIDKIYELSDS